MGNYDLITPATGRDFNVNLYYELDAGGGRPHLRITPGLTEYHDFSDSGEKIRLLYVEPTMNELIALVDDDLQCSDDGSSWASKGTDIGSGTRPVHATHCHVSAGSGLYDRYVVFAFENLSALCGSE